MTFNVTTTPDISAVKLRYKNVMEEVTNFKTMYSKIAIWLDRWNKENFKTEGGMVGGWEPFKYGGRVLSAHRVWGSIWEPIEIDRSAKLLQDTGRLRQSYLPFATSKYGGIGSSLPYAKMHNDGFKALPARRMIPEQDDVIDDVLKIAEDDAKRKLKKLK